MKVYPFFKNYSYLKIVPYLNDTLEKSKIYNPSISKPWISFNLNSWPSQPDIASNWSYFMNQSRVVIVHRPTLNVVKILRGAEDMRLVRVGSEHYGTFVRYFKRKQKRVWLFKIGKLYKEIPLLYNESRISEGNWLPFEWNNTLYVSYSICPHKVLKVDVITGKCTLVYKTHLDGCSANKRCSATGVPVAHDKWLGMSHKKHYGKYIHYFFIRHRYPPFKIINISNPIKLYEKSYKDDYFITSLTRNSSHLFIHAGLRNLQMNTIEIPFSNISIVKAS